jgi:DNA-directed RNA polymerase subunit M
MEFCEQCGAMLTHERVDDKVVLVCPKCGILDKKLSKEDKIQTMEISHSKKKKMVVIENPDDVRSMPTKKMECPKCKKIVEAQYWSVQTRSGDEAPTRFYRCTKCKHTWREYD